ncbi:MAG: ACP S-malonyltransferase [Candidatus Stahlbacteria bacterium]|nr:ACP S-malonyltransferase [Candidatus Stahlbacteria bacterium]
MRYAKFLFNGDMGRIAFVFPGQGSQFAGMGKDLYAKYPKIRTLYDKANEILGINIRDISFSGSDIEITESRNAQPCIFLYSAACYDLMEQVHLGTKPDVVAGHSLGEYSALFAAGVLEFDDALHLVRFRGELMSQTNPGTMAAVIGIEAGEVERIITELKSEGIITAANYNSPAQTVISGAPEMIAKASEILKSQGAKRVIQLNVSGAFHSPLMEQAFNKFKLVLSKTDFKPPSVPIVPNATGKLTSSIAEIKEALERQILSPVRWVESIKTMIEFGVDTFIELGPGKVLSGLIKQIAPDVKIIKQEL